MEEKNGFLSLKLFVSDGRVLGREYLDEFGEIDTQIERLFSFNSNYSSFL